MASSVQTSSSIRQVTPAPPLHREIAALSEEISSIAASMQATGPSLQQHVQLNQILEAIEHKYRNDPDALALREQFIQTFSQDRPGFDKVRETFGDRVYQRVGSGVENPWQAVVSENQPKFAHCRGANYFHATTEGAAEKILASGNVEVRHRVRLKGAFVSTRPEDFFGRTFLIFNRSIEQLPVLRETCETDQMAALMGTFQSKTPKEDRFCWVGFGHNIPVNEKTLTAVAVEDSDRKKQLQETLSLAAKRKINVVSLKDLEECLNQRNKQVGVIIPKKWDADGYIIGTTHKIPNSKPAIFSKSEEAIDGMREVLETSQAFGSIANPIATVAKKVGEVCFAPVVAVAQAAIQTTCNATPETRQFCAGLARPFQELHEQMAGVPDPLQTDYGFSHAESSRFWESASNTIFVSSSMLPLGITKITRPITTAEPVLAKPVLFDVQGRPLSWQKTDFSSVTKAQNAAQSILRPDNTPSIFVANVAPEHWPLMQRIALLERQIPSGSLTPLQYSEIVDVVQAIKQLPPLEQPALQAFFVESFATKPALSEVAFSFFHRYRPGGDPSALKPLPATFLDAAGRPVDWQKAHYFHATRELDAVEGIFKTGEIEVRARALKGAFVSTVPANPYFGNYVFGFNRRIEALPVLKGESRTIYRDPLALPYQNTGFGKGIPVGPETLEYMGIPSRAEIGSRLDMQKQLSDWAGRDISVVSAGQLKRYATRRAVNEGLHVPRAWPEFYSSRSVIPLGPTSSAGPFLGPESQKSEEAVENMREVHDTANAFATVAAPVAEAAKLVGNVCFAPIAAAVQTTCNATPETKQFCAGLFRPFQELGEQMAEVPDPLQTDYGFSAQESADFWNNTANVAIAASVALPLGVAKARAAFVNASPPPVPENVPNIFASHTPREHWPLMEQIASLGEQISKTGSVTIDQYREVIHVASMIKTLPTAEQVPLRALFAEAFFQNPRLAQEVTSYFHRHETASWGFTGLKPLPDTLPGVGGEVVNWRDAYYYHATKQKDSLKNILKTGEIEVRHQGWFEGAWVSTLPERAYGEYVLGLNRRIEVLPVPEGSGQLFTMLNPIVSRYQHAGFSKNIPVTSETLEFIAVPGRTDSASIIGLHGRISDWAGRDVSVVSAAHLRRYAIRRGYNEGISVPQTWPSQRHLSVLPVGVPQTAAPPFLGPESQTLWPAKSDEAVENMREVHDTANAFATVAAPAAEMAKLVGNACFAPIAAAIQTTCNANPVTQEFCAGFTRPFRELQEQMAAVPDPLQMDYGFSAQESTEFWENTTNAAVAASTLFPLGFMKGNMLGAKSPLTVDPYVFASNLHPDYWPLMPNIFLSNLLSKHEPLINRILEFQTRVLNATRYSPSKTQEELAKLIRTIDRMHNYESPPLKSFLLDAVCGEPALSQDILDSLYSRQKAHLLDPPNSIPVSPALQNTQNRLIDAQKAYYFHATEREEAVRSILGSRAVEVSHRRQLRGAFVSTIPETFFGEYVFAFNRRIEVLPVGSINLNARIPGHGKLHPWRDSMSEHPREWVGFEKNIPVTAETLEFIGLPPKSAKSSQLKLQDQISEWAGRKVDVVSLTELENYVGYRRHSEGIQIPYLSAPIVPPIPTSKQTSYLGPTSSPLSPPPSWPAPPEEAIENMREVHDTANAFATVAAPIAETAKLVGNVFFAPIAAAVQTTCNANAATQEFCAGFARPFRELSEQMARVPDPLQTDYGFSAQESAEFWQNTTNTVLGASVLLPLGLAKGNMLGSSTSQAINPYVFAANVPPKYQSLVPNIFMANLLSKHKPLVKRIIRLQGEIAQEGAGYSEVLDLAKSIERLPLDQQLPLQTFFVETFAQNPQLKEKVFSLFHRHVETPPVSELRSLASPLLAEHPRWSQYNLVPKPPTTMRGSRGELVDLNKAHYFHATDNLNAVRDILESGNIKDFGEALYPGAFVSTTPNTTAYGPYVFALNRRVESLPFTGGERLLEPHPPIPMHFQDIGFSDAIPLADTLEFVGLPRPTTNSNRISEWAGRDIPCVPSGQLKKYIHQRSHHEGIRVPRVWPDEQPSFTPFVPYDPQSSEALSPPPIPPANSWTAQQPYLGAEQFPPQPRPEPPKATPVSSASSSSTTPLHRPAAASWTAPQKPLGAEKRSSPPAATARSTKTSPPAPEPAPEPVPTFQPASASPSLQEQQDSRHRAQMARSWQTTGSHLEQFGQYLGDKELTETGGLMKQFGAVANHAVQFADLAANCMEGNVVGAAIGVVSMARSMFGSKKDEGDGGLTDAFNQISQQIAQVYHDLATQLHDNERRNVAEHQLTRKRINELKNEVLYRLDVLTRQKQDQTAYLRAETARLSDKVEAISQSTFYSCNHLLFDKLQQANFKLDEGDALVRPDVLMELAPVYERHLLSPPAQDMLSGEHYARSSRPEQIKFLKNCKEKKWSLEGSYFGEAGFFSHLLGKTKEPFLNLLLAQESLTRYKTVRTQLSAFGKSYDPQGEMLGRIQHRLDETKKTIESLLETDDSAKIDEELKPYYQASKALPLREQMAKLQKIKSKIPVKAEVVEENPDLNKHRVELERFMASLQGKKV